MAFQRAAPWMILGKARCRTARANLPGLNTSIMLHLGTALRALRRPVITPGSARRPQCGCTAGGNRGRSAPAILASCDLRASISAAKKLDQSEQLGALADNG